MLKLLIIFSYIILSNVSCSVRAEEFSLVEKGKSEISELYLKHTHKNILTNGNTSILYKFGKNHSCRVEFNKKNEIITSECNLDSEKRSEERLKKIYERIKEEQVEDGYCSIKLQNKSISEAARNRCLYSEYILISRCSDKNNCLDYREWYINNNHENNLLTK